MQPELFEHSIADDHHSFLYDRNITLTDRTDDQIP